MTTLDEFIDEQDDDFRREVIHKSIIKMRNYMKETYDKETQKDRAEIMRLQEKVTSFGRECFDRLMNLVKEQRKKCGEMGHVEAYGYYYGGVKVMLGVCKFCGEKIGQCPPDIKGGGINLDEYYFLKRIL